jgi:hypothetical protein
MKIQRRPYKFPLIQCYGSESTWIRFILGGLNRIRIPHTNRNQKPVPDPHQTQNLEDIEAQNGAVENL